MRRVAILVAAGGAAVLLTGCGATGTPNGDRSSNDETVQVSEAWNPRIAEWKRELLAAANTDKTVFPTPPHAVFDERLRSAAARFGFRVLKREFVHAPQGAPLVIVAAASPERFSQDTPAILKVLNHRVPSDGLQDWQGWDYEGLFLGAQGPDGKPFVDAFQFWRAHGGGEWASREDLYPFQHGSSHHR